MEAEQPPVGERVFWINYQPRRHLGRRALAHVRARGRTPRQEVPAVTYIDAEGIGALSDSRLKDALEQQLAAKQDPDADMLIPIASPDGRFVQSVVVRRVQKGTQ